MTRDAVVRVSPVERASLERELRAAVVLYLTLEQTAAEDGWGRAAERAHNLRYRYSTALRKVREGFPIDDAECAGLGVEKGTRYKHFCCAVTSEELEIPPGVVTWEDGKITAVVEGPARIVGPLHAQLSVHVTGNSAIAYRQVR